MLLLLAYLALALVVSFMCSIMESVLLSTPKSYLLVKEAEGKGWATKLMKLKAHVDKPLSAILSLNTVAHTIGAAGVGAQAVKIFGEASFGIVSAILTILILIVTEIIPKTIGATYAKNLSRISYHIINAMIFITYPLVLMSAVLTKLISKKEKESTISREELAALTNIGAEEGLFTPKEHTMIQNFLKLKNVLVKDIMTPRAVVSMIDENLLLEDFKQNEACMGFTRVPVYDGKEDNITAYVLTHEVLDKLAEDKHTMQIKELKRPIKVVSPDAEVLSLWDLFLASKEHIALVVDEYGGVNGIASMEDVIEALLGLEIVDEQDQVPNMRQYAKEQWQKKQKDMM